MCAVISFCCVVKNRFLFIRERGNDGQGQSRSCPNPCQLLRQVVKKRMSMGKNNHHHHHHRCFYCHHHHHLCQKVTLNGRWIRVRVLTWLRFNLDRRDSFAPYCIRLQYRSILHRRMLFICHQLLFVYRDFQSGNMRFWLYQSYPMMMKKSQLCSKG